MIRVLIERHIKDGHLDQYKDVIKHAKKSAGNVQGYVSGEMLSEAKNPHIVMVMAQWTDEQSWLSWEKSPVRLNIINALKDILVGNESIRIFQ